MTLNQDANKYSGYKKRKREEKYRTHNGNKKHIQTTWNRDIASAMNEWRWLV